MFADYFKPTTINIAKDFGIIPGGITRQDGNYSAEKFREEILLPKFNENYKVRLELDGTMGYSSAWLKHVFRDLWSAQFELISSDSSLVKEIDEYMK